VSEKAKLELRPLDWVGSSKKDLKKFPKAVLHEIGIALMVAQLGGKSPSAKVLKGQGSGVLEIVENDDGKTYRAAYTIKFADRVYVLHCFQKKSHKGIKTDKSDIDLIQARLKVAEDDYEQRHGRKRIEP
jgi:phage-related protein